MSQDYISRYRLYKLGGFAHSFEKILLSIGKGGELTKFTSIIYFMSYAKKMFKKMGLDEDVEKVTFLSNEWDFWAQLSGELERRKTSYDFHSFLMYIEAITKASFEKIIIEDEDNNLKAMVVHDTSLYYEYVKHLLAMRQKELFYEILSMIWLNIYANKTIDLSEIRQIVERIKVVQAVDVSLPSDMETNVVSEGIDEEKVKLQPNKIETTPLGFRKALKSMMPILEIFRDNFYKDTEMSTKLKNAEIYTFSLVVTASKIMAGNSEVKELMKNSFLTCKRIHNYNLVKTISKWRSIDQMLVNDFVSKYERILNAMILDLFEKGDKLISDVEKSTSGSMLPGESEKKKTLVYTLKKGGVDKSSLVGFLITHDDVTTIIEMLKGGEKVLNVSVDVEPFHMKFKDLGPITLVIGQTGGGKTVQSMVLVQSGLNEGYTIFDSSMNYERPTEMCFPSVPLEEEWYKEGYEKLTKLQGQKPKKWNMYILLPYYGSEYLPKKLPPCARVITIPLHTLANKPYALSLLFSSMPNNEVMKFMDMVLNSMADETWDLDRLRYELKKLTEFKDEKGKSIKPWIWVNKEIGSLKYRIKQEVDPSVVRKALALLVPSSDLITSGKAATAVNFDELTKPGVFVTPYLGNIPNKADCFAFMTWYFNAIIDYATKPENKGKKIGVLINEAQNLIPSQTLIGGMFSSEKYSMSVDFATSALNWRGLNLKVLVLTQQQSQLKEQMRSQSGLKIVFHTINDGDLKFSFDLIQNQQLKENLKMLVVNKFFKDEHLCVYIGGPEPENVKIVAGAVPTCGFELPDQNFFKMYEKMYPTEMKDTSEFIKLIEEDKKKTFLEAIKSEIGVSIELLEEGKQITSLDKDDVVTKTETLEALIAEASGGVVIPETHTVVPKTELSKMTKLKGDETVIKFDELKKFEETKPVDESKIIVPISEYFELKTLKEGTNFATVDEVCKGLESEPKTVKDVYYILVHVILSCKPFTFVIGKGLGTKSDSPYILLSEILKPLGFEFSHVSYYSIWKSIFSKSLFFKDLIRREKKGNYPLNIIDGEQLGKYVGGMNEELKMKMKLKCARDYYEKTKEMLPWNDDIKELFEEIKS